MSGIPVYQSLMLPIITDTTPDATIDALAQSIDAVLRNDLIDAIFSLSTARFEQLIVDLLIAMGYGGGYASIISRTPQAEPA